MDVTLLESTPNALDVLLFTKQTRLNMTPGMYDEVKSWPHERKRAELEYMLHTIQSSWEFVDYIFLITGVPRSFTHQLVRTRSASYAQQSQRIEQDGAGLSFAVPEKLAHGEEAIVLTFNEAIADAFANYELLVRQGADPQDAREVLPNATCANIVMKANLRTLHDFMLKRLCVRTQGMAQKVARDMRSEVIHIHPWAEPFLRVWCAFHGTCQFHNHPASKCPIKPHVFNPHTGSPYGLDGGRPATLPEIQHLWENMGVQHIQPVAHRT
jgi:flavin-dependent thymidylate synthase